MRVRQRKRMRDVNWRRMEVFLLDGWKMSVHAERAISVLVYDDTAYKVLKNRFKNDRLKIL